MVANKAKKRPPPPAPPRANFKNNGRRRGRKKKGRPSLLDLQKRTLQQIPDNPHPNPTSELKSAAASTSSPPSRRVTRRNPHPPPSPPQEEEQEAPENEGSPGGGRRREKKLNHVLRSAGPASESSDVVADGRKRRRIDGGNDEVGNQKGEQSDAAEQMHSIPGRPLDSGPTTPLPDKKLLVFILDRLQRKDKYGVFSEPVDPDELPDYHEIIERPMDFGTVRKKLLDGAYGNLECFEEDVFLISSNAMSYNSPDTIYYRQARSIQELAKKNFDNLRNKNDDTEPEPKTVARRGRPPKKDKKAVSQPSDRTAIDFSTGATLANADDITNKIARKISTGDKPWVDLSSKVCWNPSNSDSFAQMSEQKAGINEEYSGYTPKWILGKYGKKHLTVESCRRTFKQSPFSASGHESAILTSFDSEKKHLAPVGLHVRYAYARSLARFAAKLGPIGWIVASKRIEMVLPPGAKFGPGWVGDDDATEHSQPSKALIPNCNVLSKWDIIPQDRQPVLNNPAPKDCSDQLVSTLGAEVNQSKLFPQLHQSRAMHSGVTAFTPAFIASQLEKMMGSTGILSLPFQDVQMTHGQVLDLVSRSNNGGMMQQNAMIQKDSEREIIERSLMTSSDSSVPESSQDANELLIPIPWKPDRFCSSRCKSHSPVTRDADLKEDCGSTAS